MGNLKIFVFILVIVLLAGCLGTPTPEVTFPVESTTQLALNSPLPPTGTPDPTARYRQTLQANQTQNAAYNATSEAMMTATSSARPPTATRTPTKVPTTTPTTTPIPQLVWADELGVPVVLRGGGQWSPTANEYLYLEHSLRLRPLQMAVAPEFDPITFTTLLNLIDVFTWTPDGHSILYATAGGYDQERGIWVMNRDGSDLHLVNPGSNDVSFYGWLDARNVVVANRAGGSNLDTVILDISTGESYVPTVVLGLFTPNADYVPGIDNSGNPDPRLLVISKQFTTYREGMRAMGYFKSLPMFSNTSAAISMFEDWRGETNQMLVYWASYTGHVEYLQENHLLIWDVDTDALRLIAPYGVGGQFSPDGEWLTYLTFGQAVLDENGKPADTALAGDSLYMQLMTMGSQQVTLSLPTLARPDYDDFDFEMHHFLRSGFSSDSRYLAFLIPGEIQVDASGWPSSVITGTAQVHINVLDLQDKRLLWSAPASEESALSWSPTGDHLVYQDPSNNWQLFDLQRQTVIPITLSYGESVTYPDWSYDGSYLSLLVRRETGRETYIFDIMSGIQVQQP